MKKRRIYGEETDDGKEDIDKPAQDGEEGAARKPQGF